MIIRKLFNRVAATVAVTGMILAIAVNLSEAATRLKNGETVNGFIQTTSPVFRYRNESLRDTPLQMAAGEEYIFNAQRGDTIQASVNVEDGSNLSPTLVLTSSETGNQVAYTDKSNSLRYQVPTTGEYRLLVLGQNTTRGRYALSISGISAQTTAQPPTTQPTDKRRQLLETDYGLRVLDNCPPARGSLAVVYFPEPDQTYTYCATPNRLLQAGQYTYDARTDRLNPGAPTAQTPANPTTDPRRQLLQNEYGLTVLENCPAVKTSLVVAYFPEYGQTYTYCANPTRFVRAGEYTYDLRAGELKPGAPAAQTPSSPTTPNQTTDSRKQTLAREFGLTVLDNCPASTSSLVVVSYPEGNQTYRYCANPNRVFPAGEYTYNASTRSLEQAKKPQGCTVEIGGICIIR
ncbi:MULTISPECIES: hypothetical protein [unclassified Coleofasciculus]|uniref:hypothetical protein n=1 Tax=unclassified Coleofasciculus TaxID=2692782 RepID=UPI001881CB7D|nr:MULTISPECIES: hypothetical protein [unclassified Coleofasciculus]MBE9126874.1 hypothetical protein [Coleofasciculus sp. LEGE 07081]MBE9150239.1 hypothetical protein [Coleofasciculus sp. LEGE 07092]